MLSASKAVFRCPCIALLDMAGWLSHPLGTNPRSHFFFCVLAGASTRRTTPQVFLVGLVKCAVLLPLSVRQKDSDPGPISSVPSLAMHQHTCHAVTDMSNVPRTPATPSVPPPEPCVLACRNLRSHHTSHHQNGRKQAALPCSF